MDSFFSDYISFAFLLSILRGATPLVLASLAGLLSERSGIAQIGLEGMMLLGALMAAIGAFAHNSAWVGLLWGSLAGLFTAWIFSFFVLQLKADHIVAGTALNIFCLGLAPPITKYSFDSTGSTPSIDLAHRFTYQPIILSLLALAVVFYVYTFTKSGILLKFAGENSLALTASGHSVKKVRFVSLSICGILCGWAGSSLSLFLSSSYSPYMTSGRGFMALAALILGGWKPLPTFFACLFFAATDAIQMRLQGAETFIPVQFIQVLPYVVTIIALVGFWGKVKAPADLAKN